MSPAHEARDVRTRKETYFRGFIVTTWTGHTHSSLKETGTSPITANETGPEGSYASSGYREILSFRQSCPYSCFIELNKNRNKNSFAKEFSNS